MPPPDALTFIGAALVVIPIVWAAFAVRHAIRTAPYLDDESSADERHRLAQMPLPDRIAHDEMAPFFAEWDQRVSEGSV